MSGRASQGSTHQAGRLGNNYHADCSRFLNLEASLYESNERHRTSLFVPFEPNQPAEQLRILSLAGDAVAHLNIRHRFSCCQKIIRSIAANRRQIGDSPSGGDELSEATLAIL